jgi:hypothetical protein
MNQTIGTGPAAVMRPFRMVTTLTIWSADGCIIRMEIIVTIMVLYWWSPNDTNNKPGLPDFVLTAMFAVGLSSAQMLATEMMRTDAGLHADQARRHIGQPCFHLATRPLLPQYNCTATIKTDDVKCVLAISMPITATAPLRF